MRYTLDKKTSIESWDDTLFNVLDDSKPTKAYAAHDVRFNDNCEVIGGVFTGGVFTGGEFHDGEFRGGEFFGGEFHGGRFHGGAFHGGWFNGGEFNDGWFNDGWFFGGWFRGGEFFGGVFRGGEFRGGEFFGGWFNGGVFTGGEFHDGVFNDGEFHGGVFRGGEFRDGWLVLQIQGSKHFVNIPNGVNIKIGYKEHDVGFWKANFERIGKIEKYSEEQIKEYKMYIDLAATMIAKNIGNN